MPEASAARAAACAAVRLLLSLLRIVQLLLLLLLLGIKNRLRVIDCRYVIALLVHVVGQQCGLAATGFGIQGFGAAAGTCAGGASDRAVIVQARHRFGAAALVWCRALGGICDGDWWTS